MGFTKMASLFFTLLLFILITRIDGGITEEDIGIMHCCYRSLINEVEEHDTYIFIVFSEGKYYKFNLDYIIKWNLVFFTIIAVFVIIHFAYKKQKRTLVKNMVLPLNDSPRKKQTEFYEGLLATSPDNIIL